jgi:cyclopropane-fatty-acyl-phospholipid synthase
MAGTDDALGESRTPAWGRRSLARRTGRTHGWIGAAAEPGEVQLEAARSAAGLLFGPAADRAFALQYWNRLLESPRRGPPSWTLVLAGPGALRRMFLPPSELRLAEAFVSGACDVLGDLEAATSLADEVRRRLASPTTWLRLTRLLLRLPRGSESARVGPRPARPTGRLHSRRRDAAAVRSHYDRGNEFYALWLDRELTYSCGYFRSGREDLDAAQYDKLEHICRKLRLAPGERLLDIGCGWGGLVRHAARHHGARALGITLSPEQARLAQARIGTEGLSDRCRVEVRDYRDLATGQPFDKVASVGMVEHVGLGRLAEYFSRAFALTGPGGLFLNHGITGPRHDRDGLPGRLWGAGSFIERHISPDGELPPLDRVAAAATLAGFEVRDIECLREHYALTARHWLRRLEERRAAAEAMVGPAMVRTWRLYLAGCTRSFATGHLGIAQVLLCRPTAEGRAELPLPRADLYLERSASAALGS